MKNFGAILLIYVAFLIPVAAQLPSGSIAPDFNVQDINGQTQHLYELLDDDKIVLIEISATWCPPCWAYHQSGALQDFYLQHGPGGDNKARVLWVEGDPNTNLACIYDQPGCNDYSYGNFAEGTAYPILNSSAIANAFEITYFPSIFVVCPNKKLYELEPLSAENLWEKAQVCPVAYGENNAGIFAHDPGYELPEICGAVNLGPSFLLTNLGSEPLTSASIFLKWNGTEIQTIHWEGNLSTYGEAFVHFDPLPVVEGGTLNTVISSINNNAGDDDFTNNYKNNSFTSAKHFESNEIVLKIRTDEYANEIYWELRDEAGAVLDHGGNQLVGPNGGGAFPLGVDNGPGAYPSNTLIKDTLDLPVSGCYSIHFVDGYGDGMCCAYGNGYYKLYNIDNPVTPIISSGQFEAYDRHGFSTGITSATSTPVAPLFDVQLFPNPADDLLTVDIESMVDIGFRMEVLNGLGQSMHLQQRSSVWMGSTSMQVPLMDLPNGLYILLVSPETGAGLPRPYKFTVQH